MRGFILSTLFFSSLCCGDNHKETNKSISLDVNSGSAEQADEDTYKTESTTFRARVDGASPDAIHIRFSYLGKTTQTDTLGSGVTRYQFGVYLRAQNQCNLIYAMVRLSDSDSVEVQQKLNPGMSTHEQCTNSGYVTLVPSTTAAMPAAIKEGAEVEAEAKIDANILTVLIDGVLVWQGKIPEDTAVDGSSSGIRSDNVKLEFTIL